MPQLSRSSPFCCGHRTWSCGSRVASQDPSTQTPHTLKPPKNALPYRIQTWSARLRKLLFTRHVSMDDSKSQLEARANVHKTTSWHVPPQPPLWVASSRGHPDLVQLLLEAGRAAQCRRLPGLGGLRVEVSLEYVSPEHPASAHPAEILQTVFGASTRT